MPPLMLYDPIRGIPKPYPSEAEQFREYTKHEAWYYDPYTGYNRSPDEISSDPVGHLIVPPNSATNQSDDSSESGREVFANLSLSPDRHLIAEGGVNLPVGDNGSVTVTGGVDDRGDVTAGAKFKFNF